MNAAVAAHSTGSFVCALTPRQDTERAAFGLAAGLGLQLASASAKLQPTPSALQ